MFQKCICLYFGIIKYNMIFLFFKEIFLPSKKKKNKLLLAME